MRTSQARLVACHVGASHQQESGAVGERALRDTRVIVEDTIRVLSDLVKEREAQPGPGKGDSGMFSVLLDDAAISSDPVGDMAFIACAQLRRKLAELDNCSSTMPASVVDEACASGLRHVLKATSMVEPVLAVAYGLVPRLSTDAQRDQSLAVRRAYTEFRCKVRALPDSGAVAYARTTLRELTLSPSFRHVRPADRAELEALDGRLALAAGGQADPQEVLSDFVAFAEMLRSIGRREELLTHDLSSIPETIDRIDALLESGRPVLRGHLERVRGVDDDLEVMLEPGKPVDGAAVRAELRRVLEERRRTAGYS